jgi:hypothetical protein
MAQGAAWGSAWDLGGDHHRSHGAVTMPYVRCQAWWRVCPILSRPPVSAWRHEHNPLLDGPQAESRCPQRETVGNRGREPNSLGFRSSADNHSL